MATILYFRATSPKDNREYIIITSEALGEHNTDEIAEQVIPGFQFDSMVKKVNVPSTWPLETPLMTDKG